MLRLTVGTTSNYDAGIQTYLYPLIQVEITILDDKFHWKRGRAIKRKGWRVCLLKWQPSSIFPRARYALRVSSLEQNPPAKQSAQEYIALTRIR